MKKYEKAPSLMIALGMKKKPEDDDEDGSYDEDMASDIGSEVMSAINSKDDEALGQAIFKAVKACMDKE